jgi:hypothetical protein
MSESGRITTVAPVAAERFAASIGMLLSDLELEQTKKSLKLYFDTNDVRGALLGVDAFYDPKTQKFDRDLFAQRRVLVQSLAAGAWFGPIGMLSPHQAELLTAMRLNFGIEPTRHPETRAKQFWRDVGILADGNELSEKPLWKMRDERLTAFIRRQVGRAETFFKGVQAVSGTWKTRLEFLRTQRLLVFERDPVDLTNVLVAPMFRRVLDCFNRQRPYREKQASNFADAVTLVMLMEQLNDFRANPDRASFPCFYASRVFFEVVHDLKCEAEVEYTTAGGIRTSLLRDSDYFVLRAIFRPNRLAGRKVSYRSDAKLLSPDQLRKVQTRVEEILALRAPLESTALAEKLDFFGRSLVSIVRDLRHLSFFENVWLPFSAKRDAETALKQLERATRVLNSKKFKKGVEHEQKQAQKELEENAKVVRHVKSLWDTLPTAFQVHRLKSASTLRSPRDFMRRTGLFRFAVRPAVYDAVFEIAKPMLLVDAEEQTALATLIGAYGRARADMEQNLDDVEVSSVLLWLVMFDGDVIDLLQMRRRRPLLSLELIYAASCIRSGHSIDEALATVALLQENFLSLRSEHARGEMGVGLAYLLFRVWRRCNQNVVTRAAAKRRLGRTPEEIVASAIHYAARAYKALERGDQAKRAYALNLLLFYTIEAGSTDVDVMHTAAVALLAYQEQEDVWQYRYDDTVARYFVRRAELASSIAGRRTLLDSAAEFARIAKEKEPQDEQVTNTIGLIGIRRATMLLDP